MLEKSTKMLQRHFYIIARKICKELEEETRKFSCTEKPLSQRAQQQREQQQQIDFVRCAYSAFISLNCIFNEKKKMKKQQKNENKIHS